MCRNLLAKKHVLGEIEIDGGCDIWKQAMETPCDVVTRMIDLEQDLVYLCVVKYEQIIDFNTWYAFKNKIIRRNVEIIS